MRDHYPETAGFKDGGAGRDAAKSITPKLSRRRTEVLEAYQALGAATPDQVARYVGRPPHIVRPRVSELTLIGELIKTGERGESAFGAAQTIYRLPSPEERAIFHARKAADDAKGLANV